MNSYIDHRKVYFSRYVILWHHLAVCMYPAPVPFQTCSSIKFFGSWSKGSPTTCQAGTEGRKMYSSTHTWPRHSPIILSPGKRPSTHCKVSWKVWYILSIKKVLYAEYSTMNIGSWQIFKTFLQTSWYNPSGQVLSHPLIQLTVFMSFFAS